MPRDRRVVDRAARSKIEQLREAARAVDGHVGALHIAMNDAGLGVEVVERPQDVVEEAGELRGGQRAATPPCRCCGGKAEVNAALLTTAVGICVTAIVVIRRIGGAAIAGCWGGGRSVGAAEANELRQGEPRS